MSWNPNSTICFLQEFFSKMNSAANFGNFTNGIDVSDAYGHYKGTLKNTIQGTQEGICSIWNLKVKCVEKSWNAHRSSVLWIKSLSNSSVWTCGRSDAVVLWDLGCGSPKDISHFSIEEYLGFSHCDVINYNSKTLLLSPGSSKDCIHLWDTHSEIKISSLKPRSPELYGSVIQCKFIKHNDILNILIVFESGHITLWDFLTQKFVNEIKCNDNPVSIVYDNSLKRGVCGTATEKVYPFFLNKSSLLEMETEYSLTNPGVSCISTRSDQKIYATGGWDYRIRIFSWKKHKPLAVLKYHKKSIECIQFSEGPVETLTKGYLLAAGSSDHCISLWDIYN